MTGFSLSLSLCGSYPSGNLAISISEVARTMLLYTAFDDQPTITGKQIGQFDPFGNGYCNFTNGDLRYFSSGLDAAIHIRALRVSNPRMSCSNEYLFFVH